MPAAHTEGCYLVVAVFLFLFLKITTVELSLGPGHTQATYCSPVESLG